MFRGWFGALYRKGAGLTPTQVDDQGNGLPISGTVSLGASEAHLGEVGGAAATCTATPTVTTGSAYTSGYLLGGKLTLANAARIAGGSGIVESLVITDKDKLTKALDVVFFIADPTNTTFTDHAAFAVNNTDLITIVGVISVVAGDYASFSANAAASKYGLGLKFKLATGTSLFAALVTRDTPNFTTASALQLRADILQD